MKVHLRTLGCRLNQAEIDALGRGFQARGHELTQDPAQAKRISSSTPARSRRPPARTAAVSCVSWRARRPLPKSR